MFVYSLFADLCSVVSDCVQQMIDRGSRLKASCRFRVTSQDKNFISPQTQRSENRSQMLENRGQKAEIRGRRENIFRDIAYR